MIPHAGTVRSPAPTLHGRDREMGLVGDLLDRARRGRGGALTVLAGPGLGKSALLTAAAERAGDAFQTLDVRGVRAESGIPFAGLHRLLRPLTGRLPNELTGGAGPLAACAAVCEALGEAAARRPVLCLADDAHRMDRASLEALAFAARRLRGLPVAMLFAAGVPHPAAPPPGCLADLPRIALEALDDEAALRVLEELVGRDLGADVAVELTELAGGCPLALAELAAALTPGQLSGTAPPPRTLPAHSALRARYQRRYLRLAPGARRLVLLACADDDGVPVEAFTRAARADGVDPGELEAARECGLVRVADGTVSASTPLVRSVLYTDAVPGERRAVHRLLAAALDGERDASRRVWHRAALVTGPDDPMAAELAGAARGADAAGRHGEAARSWQRAAALTADPGVRRDRLLAAARCAWAAGRPARARALLRRVEPDPAAGLLRGAIELGDGLPVIAVWTLLDTADRTAADPATALAALTLAGEAADVLGDAPYRAAIAERAAVLAPADPAGRLAALHARAMAAAFRGERREARAALREVLALAAEVDDPAYADVTALVLGDDHAARSLA
ncbi:AAA family ATPase, partial [Actinomadura kijaniata]|uniref:AAA family ATPase n=1 Tax=Actinomadura kijaniata TaxID=46161 RepID=UPI003F1E3208